MMAGQVLRGQVLPGQELTGQLLTGQVLTGTVSPRGELTGAALHDAGGCLTTGLSSLSRTARPGYWEGECYSSCSTVSLSGLSSSSRSSWWPLPANVPKT